jgi:hypothetical protein
MVSTPMFHHLLLFSLLWLCFLLYVLWPYGQSSGGATPPQPTPPRRKRSLELQPFPGLIHKPLWDACERTGAPRPRTPPSPPPVLTFTRAVFISVYGIATMREPAPHVHRRDGVERLFERGDPCLNRPCFGAPQPCCALRPARRTRVELWRRGRHPDAPRAPRRQQLFPPTTFWAERFSQSPMSPGGRGGPRPSAAQQCQRAPGTAPSPPRGRRAHRGPAPPAGGFAPPLPWLRQRCHRFSTHERLTPKRAATSRCGASSVSSASMRRGRRSGAYGVILHTMPKDCRIGNCNPL